MARPHVPYVDYHPGPGDATAHFAEEAMRRAAGTPNAADGDRVTTTVSHIESPSVMVAWRLRMAELGITLPFSPFYESIQSPDPRSAKGEVGFVLWSYDGTHARPNLGAPDGRAAQAVAAIATTRYHLPTWAEKASVTAQQFGAAWTHHLLATMINPPAAPEHVHPLDWVPRVQQAAALIIANFEDGFATLRALALGPVDWVVDAAIVALGELALRSPNFQPATLELFAYLRGQIAKDGFTCYAYPLACTWLRLQPGHAELEQWRRRILAGDEGGTTSSGCIGLLDGLNMEDYAEFTVRQEMLQCGGGGSLTALARDFGLPMLSPRHTYSKAWAEAINRDPRLQLAFEQTKGRIKLAMQGIDPDSEEARFSHNIMQGKGLDQEEELRKAQAAQQQMAAGDGGDPDPVVFPGQPVARLSDYVGMMKKMQAGDFNGALSAYGLNMATYSQVAQAWGTKFGTDPTLNAKMAAMMGCSRADQNVGSVEPPGEGWRDGVTPDSYQR